MKYLYTSGLHDPTTWESSDCGVIRFASEAEAKKAAALLARIQDEGYDNGIEAAAQLAEGWDYPMLAADIRALKQSRDAALDSEGEKNG